MLYGHTFWLLDIDMEQLPIALEVMFLDDLPIKDGDFLQNQRVRSVCGCLSIAVKQ